MPGHQIELDRIWQGRGKGSAYRLRILFIRHDGKITCERIGMPSAGKSEIGTEITVARDQLEGGYEPTGEYAR